MKWTRIAFLLVLAVTSTAATAGAQGLSISLRGSAGLPVGQFAESGATMTQEELLAGAKTGFGYGLDAALLFTRSVGLYAGFDRMAFDCEEEVCGRDNSYTFSGINAGVTVLPLRIAGLTPWIKAGVTFDQLSGRYDRQNGGIQDLRSERAPGFELGAGLHVPLMGILAFSPQVRYVGQNPRFKVPRVDAPTVEQSVGYWTVDAGVSVLSPFGGGGWGMFSRQKQRAGF